MNQATIAAQQNSIDQPSNLICVEHVFDRNTQILLLLFFLTLPLVNPWVRGDGVGYYAYIRSMLVEHRLDFANDWRSANESYSMGRVRADGSIDPRLYTRTGYLDNHFSVGPAMLWAPFLVPVHGVMLTLHKFGFNVQANGYSRPYLLTMAIATALYGFLGLFISYRLTCHFVEERWALLATLGIWFASSLPVYMYFNPSWSHAHSVFAVSLFLWYWQRTRQGRTTMQWIILGLISGLVLDVYYANIAVLLVPFAESLQGYWRGLRSEPKRDWQGLGRLFSVNILYCAATLITFSPTLITRKIIYGHPLSFGYGDFDSSHWLAPRLASVLFSSDHGLLVWTPILIPALGGIYLLRRYDRALATYLAIAFLFLFYLISVDSCWDGISSFGNRFFVSITPIFILGLAVTIREFALWIKGVKAEIILRSVVGLFIVWNLAFIFQWGTHMVPARGPISWRQMVYNQFVGVPGRATSQLGAYFGNRAALMHRIEQEDVRQLNQQKETAKSK
jgi:hypothetical protein